ncbi:MAG: phosphodiester glycosidase family protein [Weeksellaceae bacterium]
MKRNNLKTFTKFENPLLIFTSIILIAVIGSLSYYYYTDIRSAENTGTQLSQELKEAREESAKHKTELEELKNVDQVVRNDDLEKRIGQIEKTYQSAVERYEELLDLKTKTNKTTALDELYSKAVAQLAERNYSSASATLATLQSEIRKADAALATAFTIPANVAESNTPPAAGSSRQSVTSEIGTYLVDIISADLGSTRVIVDTASDGDCRNDCPVKSLGEYAARSGAFAGINGPYFCPADYPSCADKKNSFDTLLMNKNKTYFNSDNNVYSTVPALIFSAGSGRLVGQSLEWGRDTGPDSVIASQPMTMSGGNVTFTGGGDPKQGSKGPRSFIGYTGSKVYIGVVHNATVAEAAYVLKALGVQNALNLDSGGSTALWSNGRYLAGPGRNTPFGILFVNR